MLIKKLLIEAYVQEHEFKIRHILICKLLKKSPENYNPKQINTSLIRVYRHNN